MKIENVRFYKTGDSVILNPKGELLFVDRKDNQVKIRGYRVEPSEIEQALLQHADVQSAVVLVNQEQDYKSLDCYYVCSQSLSPQEIKSHLSELLPNYMVPSGFCQVEHIPLTPNGKVDRSYLKQLELQSLSSASGYQAAQNATQVVPRMWSEPDAGKTTTANGNMSPCPFLRR